VERILVPRGPLYLLENLRHPLVLGRPMVPLVPVVLDFLEVLEVPLDQLVLALPVLLLLPLVLGTLKHPEFLEDLMVREVLCLQVVLEILVFH